MCANFGGFGCAESQLLYPRNNDPLCTLATFPWIHSARCTAPACLPLAHTMDVDASVNFTKSCMIVYWTMHTSTASTWLCGSLEKSRLFLAVGLGLEGFSTCGGSDGPGEGSVFRATGANTIWFSWCLWFIYLCFFALDGLWLGVLAVEEVPPSPWLRLDMPRQ